MYFNFVHFVYTVYKIDKIASFSISIMPNVMYYTYPSVYDAQITEQASTQHPAFARRRRFEGEIRRPTFIWAHCVR